MAKTVLSDLDFNSVARILNLLDPTLAQHPATKAYVDAVVQGLDWKTNARLASVANINLSSPGSSLDGVSFSSNDTFFVVITVVVAVGVFLVSTCLATK